MLESFPLYSRLWTSLSFGGSQTTGQFDHLIISIIFRLLLPTISYESLSYLSLFPPTSRDSDLPAVPLT
jgi:hypothetical protein